MLTWRTLGTITPATFNWQLYDQPTAASVFRFTFQGNLNRVWYYARVRQYFYAGDVGVSQRLYPKSESVILEMPIPAELLDAGMVIRYLGIAKFPLRRRTVADGDWSVRIEELL
ncbi:hypothetical protein [Egbenema bharatensis]|uniref:hypothetical protein n=1 Tax=Egbenema bharatensis TaxID=3463334 RepID=UPI003A882E41